MSSTPRCWNRRVRRLFAAASVAATLIMGAVTLAVSASNGGAPEVNADRTTISTTPPQVVAQPTRMAPGWQGGWAGNGPWQGGPFHGGSWPGN